ncbi:T9SS type B sorting domain-containing protein [Brumimicrobium oceani]|uniref:PKD domain-containing protein n=1 Tax=Brumimicrobium oceani TaxID=2100725 RepID=A0A2U2XAV1_9FLAO|nr:gliding motility-associated C-terminal domain-containing protein [Brumimicrobium oceani]PWH84912.1 hypothetical protein DIT68_12270 [Brumimicrobium oceani]
MNDKDEIKELFQKELGNYQAKVNPNLWKGIQAGLGSAGAASGAVTSLGFVGKIVIGVSIVTAAVVGTFLVVNNGEKSLQQETLVSDLKQADTLKKETEKLREVIEFSQEIKKDALKEQFNLVENKKTLNNVVTVEKEDGGENSNAKHLNESIKVKDNHLESIPVQENSGLAQTSKIADQKESIKENLANSALATVPVLDSSKEQFVSELSEVEISIANQENQYVSFKSEGIPDDAYVVWNFGDGTIDRSLNPDHFYSESGIYDVTLTVKTDDEEVSKRISIETIIQGEIGNLPNVFTPNGDGDNDEFFVNCKHIRKFQLTIMDNKQNIIFTTNDVDFRWRGLNKIGQPAKEGIYFYIIVAEDESGNTINKYQQLRLQR